MTLLASSGTLTSATPTIMYFTPHGSENLMLGETADIDVRINTRIPINALGVTIKYPEDTLQIIGVSKRDSFLDLWTEETSIKETLGEVHFSGGTYDSQGLMGTATVLTLSVRAKKTGTAELYFKEAEVFPHDGQGMKLTNDVRTFVYRIAEAVIGAPGSGSSSAMSAASPVSSPLPPTADFNNDGRVTISDVSILMVQMFSNYNARYDLDSDGRISLSDISIAISGLR